MRLALQRASLTLCGAATPKAARAAAAALDAACLQAFGEDAATFVSTAPATRSSEVERDELLLALARGTSSVALVALLRSESSPSHACLAASLVWGCSPDVRVARARALCSHDVLRALLDVALAVEPAAACDATSWHAARGHPAVACPAADLLSHVLCALCMTVMHCPRTAARLEKAPQRDALLRLIGRFYAPLERRADELVSSVARLHGGAMGLLKALSCAIPRGQALLWNCDDARRRIMDSLLACLTTQAAAACVRPLGPGYVPSEVGHACEVLANWSAINSTSNAAAVAAWQYVCASSLPTTLHALLADSSALLLSCERPEDVHTLVVVMHLVQQFICDPAARAIFFGAAPDGGTHLCLLLCAVVHHYPRGDAADSGADIASGVDIAIEALDTMINARNAGEPAMHFAMQHRGPGTPKDAFLLFARRHGWCGGQGGLDAAPLHQATCLPMGKLLEIDQPCCTACERVQRRDEPAFKRCARCRKVLYCSEACQKTDWEQHKPACVPKAGAKA